MTELVDVSDLKSDGASPRKGSNPFPSTMKRKIRSKRNHLRNLYKGFIIEFYKAKLDQEEFEKTIGQCVYGLISTIIFDKLFGNK